MTADQEWADHRIRSFIGPGPFVPLSVYGDIAALLAERDQLRTELATKNERLAMLEGARATTNRLLALQTKAVERLRAQVQAATRDALIEAAGGVAIDRAAITTGAGRAELIAWPGSETVEQWLRDRAAALVPTNPEPAQRSSNVCPGCNGHGRTQMFVVCPDCMGSGTFDNDGADSTEYEKSFADHEDHRSIVERASQRFRESGYTGDTVNIPSVGILTDQPDPAP